MKRALEKLARREGLEPAEMTEAMEAIVSGSAAQADIEAFLIGLREKGETVQEIAAAVRVMRRHAVHLSKAYPDALDTCGTGGDAKHTLNVSTLGALAAAAAGARVAKHGNRSISSSCGSADILEALGVPVDPGPEALERALVSCGFAFFFAPRFHPATRHAMPARQKIKGKTIFNLLGPLANPAGALRQLVGVYDVSLVEKIAEVLKELGSERALVVHGLDGTDEISLSAPTAAAELSGGRVRRFEILPEDLGFRRRPLESLRCETRDDALAAARSVLRGDKGPRLDVVCLNAGAAIQVAGLVPTLGEGVALARRALETGATERKLKEIIQALTVGSSK